MGPHRPIHPSVRPSIPYDTLYVASGFPGVLRPFILTFIVIPFSKLYTILSIRPCILPSIHPEKSSKVFAGVASTCKTSHRTRKTSDFRISKFPIFRISKFPIFRFYEFTILRISDFTIFQISNFQNFHFSEFPIFHILEFPISNTSNFQNFHFSDFPMSDFPNFRFFEFSSDFPNF